MSLNLNYQPFHPLRKKLEEAVFPILEKNYGKENIQHLFFSPPKKPEFGHFSLPLFPLAKTLKKNPLEIGKEILEILKKEKKVSQLSNITLAGPYLNFTINLEKIVLHLEESLEKIKKESGANNQNIVIDYSSVNVAKPFSIGHLRSTVIGASLKNIAQFIGFNVIGINHLGDWGTQFGKIIVALKRWGDLKILEEENPIPQLLELYIKFHEEVEKNSQLEEEARLAFKELENGRKDYQEIWQKICEVTIANLKKAYQRLGIEFEYYTGESFYNDKIESALEKVSHISEIDEGALIIRLDEENIPPLLLKKSDGATLYATRDLAALFYRKETFNPILFLYVTGAEQSLHFKQLKLALKKAGFDWWEDIIHIAFGLYRFGKEKISTRRGKIIFLEDVLNQAVELAQEKVKEKNPQLNEDKIKEISEIVGIGAIIFGDLVNDRIKNIDFSWKKILNFEGETAPYIQYTGVRLKSILRELKKHENSTSNLNFEKMEFLEKQILWQLYLFKDNIWRSWREFKPSFIANYLLDLAKLTNNFYHKFPILKETDTDKRNNRIFLIKKILTILEKGMELLGIKIPEKM